MAKDELGRREFTAASVMAILGGVSVTIGCGGGSGGGGGASVTNPTSAQPPAAAPPPAATVDRAGTVSENHGHVAMVTGAQITAPGAIAVNIIGTATHAHTVSLSVDEVRAIGTGTRVTKTSTTDIMPDDSGYGYAGVLHSHSVTFNA